MEHLHSPSDRYNYLPSLAPAVGLAWLLAVCPRFLRWGFTALVCVFVMLSIRQTAAWRDDISLLSNVTRQPLRPPTRAEIMFRIGRQYFNHGDYAKADLFAASGMGLLENGEGAIPVYGSQGAKDYPDGPPLAYQHNGIGVKAARAGAIREAEDHFRCALEIFPGFYRASFNLASLLAATGRPDEAWHFLALSQRSAKGRIDPRSAEPLIRQLDQEFRAMGRADLGLRAMLHSRD